MEWPWPPHLLAESSFSKEIRKMLQPSITDFLSVENSNSSSFQLGQISRIQGKEIPSACIHLDRSLQSVILLYEGSFGWKCISMWLAKKNLILMELEYFGFLVFILPSKQKASPADPTTCTFRHKYSSAKRQSHLHTHTGSHRRSLPGSHGTEASTRVPNTPPASKRCKEKQTHKTSDWLNHGRFYYGERIKNAAWVLQSEWQS